MATDIFAKIGDIKGESVDSKHKDEIEVLSFSWGVTNSGSTSTGGGAGKAAFQDLLIVHAIDKATPALLKACATGQHISHSLEYVKRVLTESGLTADAEFAELRNEAGVPVAGLVVRATKPA
jgi:type VI secretion system Hcp family effector